MSEKENRQVSAGNGEKAAQEADRFVDACRETFRRDIPRLFDDLFPKLDNALYDLADKSESNALYTTYFDAMKLFRGRRQEILSLFLHNLLKSEVSAPVAPSATDRDSDDSTAEREPLELMEEAELEENLAVANLVSKAENRYRNDLLPLRRHLAALRGRASIANRSDPLGPHVLCNAFLDALAPVKDLDLAIKLVVYKLFDKQVMDQLGPVYAHCRECAGELTLVPGARAERTIPGVGERAAHEGTQHPRADTIAREGDDAGRPISTDTGDERPVVFSDLQRLIGRNRPAVAGSAGGAIVDTVELMSALSRLQVSTAPELAAGDLRLRLKDELRTGGTGQVDRTLGRVDEDTLDLVFLLFEHILNGNDIPDPLKALIGRLQIPVVKVALMDKTFFEYKHHPARRLLNHLAQVAMRWNDESDRSPDSDYARVEWVVDQVIARFDGDTTIFAELDAKLSAALEREQEEAQTREIRVQQELDLREQHHSARQLVKSAIDECLRDFEPVPEPISSLLYEGWEQVLFAAYLRDGTEGAEWRNAVRTVDRLVWSVQPKVEYEDRRELLRNIPELLRTLRESLADVSYDQRRLARWFKELQALHIVALRGSAAGAAGATGRGSRARVREHPAEPAAADMEGAAADARGADARIPGVPGVRAGAWMEVRRDDGSLMRVKLAWRSPRSGNCLLVDRRGQKVLELTAEDVLSLTQQGTLTVLGDTPVVDRAMSEMLQTLRLDGQ